MNLTSFLKENEGIIHLIVISLIITGSFFVMINSDNISIIGFHIIEINTNETDNITGNSNYSSLQSISIGGPFSHFGTSTPCIPGTNFTLEGTYSGGMCDPDPPLFCLPDGNDPPNYYCRPKEDCDPAYCNISETVGNVLCFNGASSNYDHSSCKIIDFPSKYCCENKYLDPIGDYVCPNSGDQDNPPSCRLEPEITNIAIKTSKPGYEPIDNMLKCYWDFNEKNTLTFNDIISGSNMNKGSFSNVGWSTDKYISYPSALDFKDGADVQITNPNYCGLDGENDDFSISLWIYSKDNRPGPIMQIGNFALKQESGYGLSLYSNSTQYNTNTALKYNEWVQITISINSSNYLSLYKNGLLAYNKTIVLTHFNNPSIKFGGNYFNGIIDDVKIYDKGLSPRQVRMIGP